MPAQTIAKARLSVGATNSGINLDKCATWNGTTSNLSFTIPTSFDPANLPRFSFGMWINSNNAGEGGGFGNPFQLGFLSAFYDNFAGLKVTVPHSSAGASVYTAGILSFNAWHRLIVLWDDTWSIPKVFIDGEETSSGPTTKSGTRSNVSGGTAYIGNNSAGTRTCDGEIDQIDIWSRVLTHEEIIDDWYFGPNAGLSSGKIFSLPMNETSGNYIDTVGGIECTPSNLTQNVASYSTSDTVVAARSAVATRYSLFGEEDDAYLSGSNSSGIEIPITPSTGSFSVMFRMLSQDASSDCVLSYQSNFNSNGFEIRSSTNTVVFVRYNNTSPSQVDTTFTPGWHSILCTYSGGTLRLWVDGVQRDSDFFSAFTAAAGQVMRIGGRSFTHSFNTWTGHIKDFVFKNGVVWGSTEANNYMNNRAIPSAPDCYYKFNGDATDSSGNGNNGTDNDVTYDTTSNTQYSARGSV